MSTASLASGAERAQERSLARGIGTGDPRSGAELRGGARCAACRGRAGWAPGPRAEGRRRQAGSRRLEALGVETLGDLLWHVPHGYRDRCRDRARSPSSGSARRRRSRSRCGRPGAAHPPAQPADRRGHGRRRQRPAEGCLVQPGLARRAAAPGHEAAAQRQARPPRLQGQAHEILGGQGAAPAGLHTTGIVAGPSGHRAAPRAAAARVGLARRWRWLPTRSSRCRAELRARHRLARRPPTPSPPPTSPERRRRRGRAAPARLRGALPAPGRAGRRAAGGARTSGRRARSSRRAS